MNNLEAKKVLLSCPGDTIQENIDYIGMSQAELAMRMGRSKEKLNEIIKGKAAITQDTAIKLEYVLSIPFDFWLELERKYQEEVLAIEKMEFLEHCLGWLKKFPISKMKKLSILPQIKNKELLVDALLRFFRVASPIEWGDVYSNLPLAFKIDTKFHAEKEAISVWLRYGEIQSEKVNVKCFDKKGFKENLYVAKQIAYEHPIDWQAKLQDFCANYGVALVYTPCISKAPIYGATRWIKGNSTPLLQITDRKKDGNAFWFTFFHECGHIILHGKKDIFLEGVENIRQDELKERQADDFAGELLIPKNELAEMVNSGDFTVSNIKKFSKKFSIHAGVLVSQLQRIGKVEYNNMALNSLKQKINLEC